MSKLDAKIICMGHYFAYTEIDAANYITIAIKKCKDFFKLVENLLNAEQFDIEKVKKLLKQIEYDEKSGLKQPEPAYLLNLEARIKVVKKYIGEKQNETKSSNS